ncbi:GGDEF domain-containing protein [Helicobacter sp. 23-1046]
MPEDNNDFFGNLGLELESEKSDTGSGGSSVDSGNTKEKIDEISKKAIKMLGEGNIFPLPENFESLFERLLKQDSDKETRNKILKVMESRNTLTNSVALEKGINESFTNLKVILQNIGAVCQQLESIEKKARQKLSEIDDIQNPLTIKTSIKVLLSEVQNGYHTTFEQIKDIAKNYTRTYASIVDIRKNSMFDTVLGVHNKRFFLTKMEQERVVDKEFSGPNAVFALELAPSVFAKVRDKNSLLAVLKMVAKILHDEMSRNDFICHLGEADFGIFVKNLQASQIESLANSFISRLQESNVFVNEDKVPLNVIMGASVFNTEISAQDNVRNAKVAVHKAKTQSKNFETYAPGDEASLKSGEKEDNDAGNIEIS